MGAECMRSCVMNDNTDLNSEFIPTSRDIYNFKRMVFIYSIYIQYKPKSDEKIIYYGLDSNFDKNTKGNIMQVSTLTKNLNDKTYTNGNVKVIIPC